jgi:hypothetical protein
MEETDEYNNYNNNYDNSHKTINFKTVSKLLLGLAYFGKIDDAKRAFFLSEVSYSSSYPIYALYYIAFTLNIIE